MWPKQNFESGFGDWRNRSSGVGWNRNVNSSRNWKSWPAGSRNDNSNYKKKATTKPASKPTKRTLSKTGTKTKAAANKRQKVVTYSQIPLTTVMLVNPGSEASELPELVFGGFYDCVREAKVGKPRQLLQIDVTKKTDKKKREDANPQADWHMYIPVPTTSVEAVSIISGTNPFEKLLKAHSDRISLKNSIDHWSKVIRGRALALQRKEEELRNLQEIEDRVKEVPQLSIIDEEKTEKEGTKDADADPNSESSPNKSESQTKTNSTAGEEDGNWTKDQETGESKEELKKRIKKERDTRIRKRKFITSVVRKLTSAVEKAKQSLSLEQAKLDKISGELGDELAFFQNEMTDDEALSYFKEQLQDETEITDEQDDDCSKENAPASDKEDVEMAAAKEDLDKSKDKEEDTEDKEEDAEDVEMVEAEDEAVEETEKTKNDKTKSVKEVKKDESPKKTGKITETPVWIIVSLKKPLERATVTKNSPCNTAEHLKKASMIMMKFQPKHKKTIVLKGVTYQGSEEYLKVLNQVLEGPWKGVRKDPNELLKSKSPYSLEKTLKYLVMCQTRREVLDNITEDCELCEKSFKHSAMAKHLMDFCPMREKPCQFCASVFAVSLMKEHHESECTKYPISCPAKCPKKFARADAEEHKKVCLNAVVDCDFKGFGCSKQLKRKDLSRHVKTAVYDHLELVKGRVSVLAEYIMKNDPDFKDIIMPTVPEPESE